MKTIELDMYQATAVAALVLLLGRVLVAKISILRRYRAAVLEVER